MLYKMLEMYCLYQNYLAELQIIRSAKQASLYVL
jgi:hypothetical protein